MVQLIQHIADYSDTQILIMNFDSNLVNLMSATLPNTLLQITSEVLPALQRRRVRRQLLSPLLAGFILAHILA